MARLKPLAIAIPKRQVHLRLEKFTNLVGLELTFTNCKVPLIWLIVDAL
jgi:hypothetical protein